MYGFGSGVLRSGRQHWTPHRLISCREITAGCLMLLLLLHAAGVTPDLSTAAAAGASMAGRLAP
jgi:hypothetical protein